LEQESGPVNDSKLGHRWFLPPAIFQEAKYVVKCLLPLGGLTCVYIEPVYVRNDRRNCHVVDSQHDQFFRAADALRDNCAEFPHAPFARKKMVGDRK
jgi:hypothetical protein